MNDKKSIGLNDKMKIKTTQYIIWKLEQSKIEAR